MHGMCTDEAGVLRSPSDVCVGVGVGVGVGDDD